MTISPPANVRDTKNIPFSVLAYGVDTLNLALDITWNSEGEFFRKLTEYRCDADEQEEEVSCVITGPDGQADWVCALPNYGDRGYQWILTAKDYHLKIGNWMEPKSRPSVMVEIRSETLWTHGVDAAVQRILKLLENVGAKIETVKLSRLDLCVDLLMTASDWHSGLMDCFNTRAQKIDPHTSNRKLTGFSIGAGVMSARLYDKWREIIDRSQKFWMFDIWGMIPAEDEKVIRTEFQLRREQLKELQISEYEQLEASLPNIWSYCSKRWLKVVDDPNKHPARQKLLPWWEVVQNGFPGAQNAFPLVRGKSISHEQDALINQIQGFVAALTGLLRQGDLIGKDETLDTRSHMRMVIDLVCNKQWTDEKFTKKVKLNQVKRIRYGQKFEEASRVLNELGLSLEQLHSRESPHHD